MKQLVLSVEDESDERLRRLARELKGGRKGSLSATVEEALLVLEKDVKQKRALLRLKELANRGRNLGVGTFDRRDAYSGHRFD